jgi:hypothetical protein
MAAIRAGQPRPPWPSETKHELLGMGHPDGPSKFFFAVPAELEEAAQPLIPAWAGLLTVLKPVGPFHQYATIRETIAAPRLHMANLSDGRLTKAYKNGYHRYTDIFWGTHNARMFRLAEATKAFAPKRAFTD